MWLLDIREPAEENGRRSQPDHQTSKLVAKQNVKHRTQTRNSNPRKPAAKAEPKPKGFKKSVSLEREIGIFQFCVTRLVSTPIISRVSFADQISTQTDQPIPISYPGSLADINIVMDPQPFPRQFLGKIRSMTIIICDQGTKIEDDPPAPGNVPNTRPTPRDPTASDI